MPNASGALSMVVFTSEGGILIVNGELFVIHELCHQGLSISAIARQTGLARKTVREYLRELSGSAPFSLVSSHRSHYFTDCDFAEVFCAHRHPGHRTVVVR